MQILAGFGFITTLGKGFTINVRVAGVLPQAFVAVNVTVLGPVVVYVIRLGVCDVEEEGLPPGKLQVYDVIAL